ncbi:MAG: LytTR family DNA-binding domain-containing protein [Saonia sp.]
MAPLKSLVRLSFPFLGNWRVLVGVGFFTTSITLGIYYLHPANLSWFQNADFSFSNLLQFFLIDQFLIEMVTVIIVAASLQFYSRVFEIKTVLATPKGILYYYIRFLPLLAVLYFLIAPFTIHLRLGYHYFVLNRTNLSYWDSYFFLNSNLYVAYLFPLFLIWISLLTINFLMGSKDHKGNMVKSTFKSVVFSIKTEMGEKLVNSNDVVAIEKVNRKYILTTSNGGTYQIMKNLSELQSELDHNFFRLNRSTLINLEFMENFSFWENEKYIVRTSLDQEFKSTRPRIKKMKEQLKNIAGKLPKPAYPLENIIQ